ncbi:MAG: thioredoxin domain-containing protein [Myxococcota bacterium]
MPNRLAKESSPYLRQHMDNPVDWYPWGEEALSVARTQDKPILLSVGYAACHWCHVMEHESFEDAEVARLMNQYFVPIKVDREERPDIDHIYMTACHVFTGSGGWPLTVFLTPDLRPFFAGTYFPKDDKYGRPGFKRVLMALADAYRNQRSDVEEQAQGFERALRGLSLGPQARGGGALNAELVTRSADLLMRRFDEVNGGFGRAPKFPNSVDLLVLEAAARRGHEQAGRASLLACTRMAEGGIYDQLGGGFHRYSVDEKWLIPHFEKMLYDNALLPRVYLAAYRRTAEPLLRRVVEETFTYLGREMTAPGGAFFATQDADSEGEEGKFFVWRPEEIEEVLGRDAGRRFCLRYGVTAQGNFEHGTSVLHIAAPLEQVARLAGVEVNALAQELEESRRKLWAHREKRIKPGRDEKIIAGWNGLMISALCDAAATLQENKYLEMATRALDFILEKMRMPDGGLYRIHADGVSKIQAFLEDYAFLAQALCDAHRASGESRHLTHARELCEQILRRFQVPDEPGFFMTEANAPGVLVRSRSLHDEAVPSGAWVATSALHYVGVATGNQEYVKLVERILEHHAAELTGRTQAYGTLLLLADRVVRGSPTVVVAGAEAEALLSLTRALTDSDVLVLPADTRDGLDRALLEGKSAQDGKAAAYVCAGQTCQAPATDVTSLKSAVASAGLQPAAHV